MSTPTVHIRDFTVRTPLDDDFAGGELQLRVAVRDYAGHAAGQTYGVRARLFDGTGASATEVWTEPLVLTTTVAAPGADAVATAGARVEQPRLWSAERPDLYTLVLELLNPAADRSSSASRRGSASARRGSSTASSGSTARR